MAAHASSGPPSVASDGEHSHASHSPSDGRRDRRKRKRTNRWLTALMVVDFDVDTGHKPVFCIPTGALSMREQAQCSVLAMPDSNTGLMGDTVYTFRMRRDRLPLFATSLAAHEYLFGTSFFRQVHDPTQPRSFSQRAVVAVSQRPYPGLCSQVVRVSGPPFLDAAGTDWAHACAVLESSWDQSCRWPRPVPGVSFDHPLLGRLLQFRCPFTATDDGTAPGAADSRILGRSSRSAAAAAASSSSSSGRVCALQIVAAGWSSSAALDAAIRAAVLARSSNHHHHHHHRPRDHSSHSVHVLSMGTSSGHHARSGSDASSRSARSASASGTGDESETHIVGHSSARGSTASARLPRAHSDASSGKQHGTLQRSDPAKHHHGGSEVAGAMGDGLLHEPDGFSAPSLDLTLERTQPDIGDVAEGTGPSLRGSLVTPGSAGVMSLRGEAEEGLVVVAAHTDEDGSAGGSFRRGFGSSMGSVGMGRPTAAHTVRGTGDFGVPVTLSPSADAAVANNGGGSRRSTMGHSDEHQEQHDDDDDDDEEEEEEEEASGAEGGVTLTDAFAARWQELPGVFQEVGLFSTFRALVPCLWTLWEMALLGRPVLVFGPSPKLCGDAVMGIVSLVAPLPYHGDYRPYFTLYDPDFAPIQAAFENQGRRAALPPPPSPIIREALEAEAAEASAERDRISRHHHSHSDMAVASASTASEVPSSTALPHSATDIATSESYAAGPAGIVSVGKAHMTGASVPLRVVGRGQKHPFAMPPTIKPDTDTGPAPVSTPGVPPLPAAPWQTPLVLGSTNPIFVRALAGFPVTVWIGAHPDALPNMPKPTPQPIPSPASEAATAASEAAIAAASPSTEAASPSTEAASPGGDALEPTVSTPSLSVPQLMVRLGSDGHDDASTSATPLKDTAAASSAGSGSGLTQHGEGVWKRATGSGLTPERAAKLAARLRKLRESRLRQLANHPFVTPTIVPSSTALHTLLPRPGEEPESAARLIIKRGAAAGAAASTDRSGVERDWGSLVPPDSAVLNQLLKIKPEDEMGPQLRLNAAGSGARGGASIDAADDSAEGGDVPGVVINNALLRQHFRRLTHAFLRPFERFFTIGPVELGPDVPARVESCPALKTPIGDAAALTSLLTATAELLDELETTSTPASKASSAGSQPRQPTFGPYDNLAAALLPTFTKESFLAELATKQPPKLLRRVPRWLELYRRFVESPHFRPWFTARREEARANVAELTRRLRLAVPAAQLTAPLEATDSSSPDPASAVPTYPPAPPAEALRLYSNILSCVQRERVQLTRDLTHSAAIAGHLAAVESVLHRHGYLTRLGIE